MVAPEAAQLELSSEATLGTRAILLLLELLQSHFDDMLSDNGSDPRKEASCETARVTKCQRPMRSGDSAEPRSA